MVKSTRPDPASTSTGSGTVLPVDEARSQLSAALDAFERDLPDLDDPRDWPPLTPSLAERLHKVRDLARSSTIGETDGFDFQGNNPGRTHWPRPTCIKCAGIGWYWIDPELGPRDWEPCRRCLTTGLTLRHGTTDQHRSEH